MIDTLTSLFAQDFVKETYFYYNNETKHRCRETVFKDFCCSGMYKNSQFFAENPNAIQLQLFVDGFEVCDPLKSKANKHSQIATYFTIRNMPQELAYNLENIHLVSMCNANYLKPAHVNYNDLWEKVVPEIRALETIGIVLTNGDRLKGERPAEQ